MTHLGAADDGVTAIEAGTLARAVLGRFESLVSPKILERTERAAQGSAIGALVAAGLLAALLSPFAGLAEIGIRAVVLPTIVAGACLALAGLLASSGRLELVLVLSAAIVSGLVAILASMGGGLSSPLLWLLIALPVEAAVSGRRTLSVSAAGIACLSLGGVAFAEWMGLVAPVRFAFDTTLTVGAGIAYAGLQTMRLRQARAASREMREIETAEARLIEDALSDAVLRFSAEGRLLSASRAAEAMFSDDIVQLGGTGFFGRIHVTDRVRYLKAMGDVKAGAAELGVEVRIGGGADRSEGFRDIALKLVRVCGARGSLAGIVCIARDVTGERLQTAELCRALDEARRGSDAKSHFLASVSHELRTPLNAIIGFSDVLDQEFFGGFENPRQKEYVGLIRQSGEHLLSVVNGLLDISKIEAGRYELQLESFVVADALQASVDLMRPEAERKGLRLELLPRCGAAEIVADRRACHQILLNLLSNAVKFTDAGKILLAADVRDGALLVTVSDTGIGIAADDIARLGTPFTQVSTGLARRYQGTGLGLSLVKGLSELHHGEMKIASEPGRGTTVTVRIPLDCAARIADQQTSNENVVTLPHARKKNLSPTPDAARRTA